MKRSLVLVTTAVASTLLFGQVAAAQSNPFVPQNQGGITRQQAEEIARKAAEEQAKAAAASAAAGSQTGAGPAGVDTANIQSQPGVPNGSPVQGAPGSAPPVALSVFSDDPVAGLIEAGGTFVGCVRDTPIFRDKAGRRIYFTTKEIRDSGAARRYARC